MEMEKREGERHEGREKWERDRTLLNANTGAGSRCAEEKRRGTICWSRQSMPNMKYSLWFIEAHKRTMHTLFQQDLRLRTSICNTLGAGCTCQCVCVCGTVACVPISMPVWISRLLSRLCDWFLHVSSDYDRLASHCQTFAISTAKEKCVCSPDTFPVISFQVMARE